MIIKSEEKLNLILNLPFKNNIMVGDLKFHQKEISFNKRISKLYMESIGFTPYYKGNGDNYHYYECSIGNKNVEITEHKKTSRNDYLNNRIDIKDSEILETSNLLDGFVFVLAKYNDNNVIINKYIINKENEEVFNINVIDVISLSFKNKNLIVSRNNKEIDISEAEDFFKDIDYGQDNIYRVIIPYIYDSFANEKGFLDIYEEYRGFIDRNLYNLSDYDKFRYHYYVGQIDFYYLAEYLIKSNMKVDLYLYNPVITGKPIQKIKDIPVLSKNGIEMMKKYAISTDNTILYEVESNKKIGKDGLKIIDDYLTAIGNIRNVSYGSVFSDIAVGERVIRNISIIINTFDITPKNLMDRITRAIFYENYRLDFYISLIIDTIRMAKKLKIDLGNKLPKDIVNIHDLLSDQIKYIKNEKVEEMFKTHAGLNNELLKFLPHSNELTIISPLSPNDLVKEGIRLKHCVGSYVNRYTSGYSKIFFVRKKSNIDEPFVTLELGRNNELVQVSAFGNKNPNESVNKFIIEWVEKINNIKVEV